MRQKNIENIQNYVYAELINSVVKTYGSGGLRYEI